MGRDVVGVEADRLLVGPAGALQVALARPGQAENIPDVGVLGRGLADAVEVVLGVLEIAALEGLGPLSVLLGRIEVGNRLAGHRAGAAAAHAAAPAHAAASRQSDPRDARGAQDRGEHQG